MLNIATFSNVICREHHQALWTFLTVKAHLNYTLRNRVGVAVRKWGAERKEILIPEREVGRGPDGEVPGELVMLHLPGAWGTQSSKLRVVLLETDPSPAPVTSVCLHQVCQLVLVLFHNKSRWQGQGYVAVPTILLPWRTIDLDCDGSQV